MRILLVSLLAAGLLILVWQKGLGGEDMAAVPTSIGPGSDAVSPASEPARSEQEPAAKSAPAPALARGSIATDESFQSLMEQKYGDLETEKLINEFWRLSLQVKNAAMTVGQPEVVKPDAPLWEGDNPGPEVVFHIGPGRDRRMRFYVLPEEDHPELYRKRREEIWLRDEAARRRPPGKDGSQDEAQKDGE